MYEYVKKSEYAPVRKELEEIIKRVQNEMRKTYGLTFQFQLIGSYYASFPLYQNLWNEKQIHIPYVSYHFSNSNSHYLHCQLNKCKLGFRS